MNGYANRAYFDEKAAVWDSIVVHDPEKMGMIVARSGIGRGRKVLDIGSGTGVMLPFLREAIGGEGHLVALDVSPNMIDLAKQRYGSAADEYLVADFYEFGPAAMFDAVMAYSCFPHFGDRTRFFSNAFAMLKSGGKLVIAHSEAKETINGRHSATDVHRLSLDLPPVDRLGRSAAAAGFSVLISEDTDRYYLLVLGKSECVRLPIST
jgi:ubiquinone/menaquinone biosynthesis C-methylase UbiE